MKAGMAKVLVVASALGSVGCSIQQTVDPVAMGSDREVCIIEHTETKRSFLDAYRNSLESSGYEARVLPARARIIDCPVTSTYEGRWSWDLLLYLSYADIRVYRDGSLAGQAKYDSTRGGGNMGKFIDAEKKVDELVDQLFPGR